MARKPFFSPVSFSALSMAFITALSLFSKTLNFWLVRFSSSFIRSMPPISASTETR